MVRRTCSTLLLSSISHLTNDKTTKKKRRRKGKDKEEEAEAKDEKKEKNTTRSNKKTKKKNIKREGVGMEQKIKNRKTLITCLIAVRG